jgi:hypothetical protein
MGAAASGTLSSILPELPPTMPIISLGAPRVLYPVAPLVVGRPLLIFEQFPERTFTRGLQGTEDRYKELLWAEMRRARMAPSINTCRIFVQNIAQAPRILQAYGQSTAGLYLLDTTNLAHLTDFERQFRAPGRWLDPGSYVMLNVDNLRHPGRHEHHARILLRRPQLLAAVDYVARGTRRRTRTLAFYRDGGSQ